MELIYRNALDAPAASGGYSQAVEVIGPSRLLFVSGQVPEASNGEVPNDFGDQCRLAWRNVQAQLASAGMSLDNLVKVTTFLARRQDRQENSRIRQELLGHHAPALTVLISEIYSEDWLLEIEVIAAA